MTKKFRKAGFTLIELLVVIAIIGVLASVVLASLNTARGKGADSAVKSNLANARAQAELYYDGNTNSYANVCTAAGGISESYAAANAANGGTAANADCNSSATAWAMAAQLVADTTQIHCVDSTGASETMTGNIGGSGAGAFSGTATVCP